jgi:hypothetical protein
MLAITLVSRICCFAGCSLHPIPKFIWKPWLVFEMVRHIWLSMTDPVFGPEDYPSIPWLSPPPPVYLPVGRRSNDTCEHRLSSFKFFEFCSEMDQGSVSAWDLDWQGLFFDFLFENKWLLEISPYSSSIITTHHIIIKESHHFCQPRCKSN